MEPYFLTEEDIRNFGIQGAIVGEQATDADLEAMGMLSAEAIENAPAVAPSQTTLNYSNARLAGADPATAPQSGGFPVAGTPTPSPAMGAGTAGGMTGMLDFLSTPIPQDPFENLSRAQRTMIGFAALKDAGMALQGKEGGAVRGVMDDIANRADMERKRQIQLAGVQQEQARLQQQQQQQARIDALLMGVNTVGAPTSAPASAGPQAAPSVSIDDQITALRSQLGTYAQLDQMPVYEQRLAELTEMRDLQKAEQTAQAEKQKANAAQILQAKDALTAAEKALGAAAGLEGDELAAAIENKTIAGEARKFLLPRFTGIEGGDYKDYKAAAAKLASVMTFQNLAGVIATGATLGVLSNSDIEMLRNMSGVIDVEDAPIQTAETIFDLYGKLKETISRIEAEGGDDPFDELAQKYGSKK